MKRFGIVTSNTVLFGSGFLLPSLGSLVWAEPPHEDTSPAVDLSVIYIGLATAAVFLLRYRSLQTLAPTTVDVYHNLIPICTILFAHLYTDEAVGVHPLIGGVAILLGAELVRRISPLAVGSVGFPDKLLVAHAVRSTPTHSRTLSPASEGA